MPHQVFHCMRPFYQVTKDTEFHLSAFTKHVFNSPKWLSNLYWLWRVVKSIFTCPQHRTFFTTLGLYAYCISCTLWHIAQRIYDTLVCTNHTKLYTSNWCVQIIQIVHIILVCTNHTNYYTIIQSVNVLRWQNIVPARNPSSTTG